MAYVEQTTGTSVQVQFISFRVINAMFFGLAFFVVKHCTMLYCLFFLGHGRWSTKWSNKQQITTPSTTKKIAFCYKKQLLIYIITYKRFVINHL